MWHAHGVLHVVTGPVGGGSCQTAFQVEATSLEQYLDVLEKAVTKQLADRNELSKMVI